MFWCNDWRVPTTPQDQPRANQIAHLLTLVAANAIPAIGWFSQEWSAATTLIVGAAYTLWMYKRVVFGAVGNHHVAELTDIKLKSKASGLLMVGSGVPKNFVQDTVVCAEILGHDDVEVHKYAVQITVADVRDGACSSSTLKEAASWGKVQTTHEQMVFAEATTIVPLIASDAYHRGVWKTRKKPKWAKLFE